MKRASRGALASCFCTYHEMPPNTHELQCRHPQSQTLTQLLYLYTPSGLCNEDVWVAVWRRLCSLQVSVLLTRVVASVHDACASDLNVDHGSSQHVTSIEVLELDAIHDKGLVEAHGLDGIDGLLEVGFIVQLLISGHVGDLSESESERE